MSETLEICRMERGDIAFGMTLKDMAGWNQLPVDWERFQEFQPDGCFLVRCDGRPGGTATTIAYEKLFGWVGMVLVHPDMRRRGLGTALLMAGIEYLEQAGVAAVKLDATPVGKQLYDTIGFVDEYRLERWQGQGRAAAAPPGLVELTAEHLPALQALDQPAFGADRSRVLRRLVTEPTIRTAAVIDAQGAISGYAAIRPGRNAMYFGPSVALDAEVGERLWWWGLAMAGEAPVFADLLLPNEQAVPLAKSTGFLKQRELIRMFRGTNVSPGKPELQYAIFGPEIG